MKTEKSKDIEPQSLPISDDEVELIASIWSELLQEIIQNIPDLE